MYPKQMEQSSTVTALQEQPLERQLEGDDSGELRDRLFGELHGAALHIETALMRRLEAGQVEVLRSLLESVNLSQALILEVWNSLHRNGHTQTASTIRHQHQEITRGKWLIDNSAERAAGSAEADGSAERDVSILSGD